MEKKWYVVNTYSGHENKVKEKLEMRAESMDMEDYIFRVIVPEEKVVEVKDGVTKEKGNPLGKNTLLVVYFKTCDSCEEINISLRGFKKFCRRNYLSRKNILKIDLTPTELKTIDVFMKKHKGCLNTSTIGGKYSFIVTHTGLGPLVDIKCNICDEVECVTDSSKF